MSLSDDQKARARKRRVFNLTLASVAGQVGCLTIIIILASLFGGLWLDNRFQVRPAFTIGLMVISIPITLVMMFWIVRTTTSKMKLDQKTEQSKEEE
jgi:MFS-type transporter involved in bile tolerance (Atg22 family)